MELLIPYYYDQHYTVTKMRTDRNSGTIDYKSKANNESLRKLIICNCCSNPVVISYNSEDCITNITPDSNLSRLNHNLLIHNLFCKECNSLVGYKIASYNLNLLDISPDPTSILIPQQSISQSDSHLSHQLHSYNTVSPSKQSSVESQCSCEEDELTKFKNNLFKIEQNVNARVELLDRCNYVQNNESLVGKSFLFISRVTCN
ncbi:uncharacterized protein RJT21DRAFT_113562 [Scheffersomyces amazonensis]|uniref:uncharacterized protein n=1 Tax=Scheffersomyces amazonensis TaxID=1078765 RepID=UPI00315CA6D2